MDAVLAGARRAVVLGAVRSGVAAAEALVRCAPHVHVVLADRRPDAGEAPPGVEAVPGRDDPELLTGADLLVKSPGVPEEAAIVRAARSAGIPVWAEVELAYRLLEERNPIVGITGTNGKTTTTLLTAAMLERGGVPCASAGNVGNALSTLAGRIEPGRPIVCELSSFQLEGVEEFRSDVASCSTSRPTTSTAMARSSPTRPPSCGVFERQRESDTAILCVDDAYVAALDDGDLPGAAAGCASRERSWSRSRRPSRPRTCAAPTTAPTRPARSPWCAPWARTRVAPPLRYASSRHRRTGSSRYASCAASATSTTPRRPTSRPRCRRSRRSTRPCT